MTGSNKTEQYLHENVAWKQELYLIIHENSTLKTRLSEVVDRVTNKAFIAEAEYFQNEFILKDECLMDIGNDIKRQEKLLREASIQKSHPDHKVCKMQEKLRNEMSYLQKDCTHLKNQFNKYLHSIVAE